MKAARKGLTRRGRFMVVMALLLVGIVVGVAIAWESENVTLAQPTSLYVNVPASYSGTAISGSNETAWEVVFSFPPNTDPVAASVTITHGGASVSPDPVVAVDPESRTVTATFSSRRTGNSAARTIVATVNGVVNPSEPGSYTYYSTFTAQTQGGVETTIVGDQTFALLSNPSAPSVGTVTLGSALEGEISSYSFPVTVGPYGRLAADAEPGGVVTPNTIHVLFPPGTQLPVNPVASHVVLSVGGTDFPLESAPTVEEMPYGWQRMSVEIPSGLLVPGGGTVQVLFTEQFGIRNPEAGEYDLRVSTSAEEGLGTSPDYTIEAYTDTDPPVVTLSVTPAEPDGAAGWYVTVPAITATTDEPALLFYSFVSDAGPWEVWATPLDWPEPSMPIFAPEGTSMLHYYAEDTSGNASAVATYAFAVDTVAPATPVLSAVADGTDAIDLSWDAVADASSGVASYALYAAADDSLLATTTAGVTTYRAEGLEPGTAYGFYLTATDVAGNTSAPSDTASATTEGDDVVPPQVTLSVDPPDADGREGWYVTTPEITATVDATATIFYRFDDGNWRTWSDPADPINPPEGESTLSYYAEDLVGNASDVETYGFKVDTVAPEPPVLAATAGGTDAIDLSWSPVVDATSGIDYYSVYRFLEPSNHSLLATTTAETYQVTGLSDNTTYEFYVTATDVAGNTSAASNTASATTEPSDTSPPFTTLSVDPPDGDNEWYRTAPGITLIADPDIASTIYYAWDAPEGWQEYTTPLVAPEGEHNLYYYAKPAEEFRQDEPVRSASFKVDTEPPSVPEDVSWTPQGADGALIEWSASTDLTSGVARYDVYVNGALRVSSTTLAAAISNLAFDTDYAVYVKAVDFAGNQSGQSATVTVRIESAPTAPEPPDRVVARAVGEAQVFLAWGPPLSGTSGTVTYHVWRSSDGDAYVPVGSVAGFLNRWFIDVGAASSKAYRYAVAVEDVGGIGELSSTSATDTAYAEVVTSAPPIPRNLTAEAYDVGVVSLSWSPVPVPDVAGYRVYRSTVSGAAPSEPLAFVGSGTVFVDDAADPYQRYWYSVAAVDTSGASGSRSMEAFVRTRADIPVGTLVPHASFTEPGSRRCQICHAVSGPQSESGLLVSESSRALCETCHDGTGAPPVTYAFGPDGQLPVHAASDTLTCTDCHTPHSGGEVGETNLLLSADGARSGNDFCYACHGQGSGLPGGDMRFFEASSHGNGIAAPGGSAQIVCMSCHASHASPVAGLRLYDDFNGCLRCHSEAGTDPDILTRITYSDDPSSGHDLSGGAPGMTCQNCHSTHSVSSEYPLVDPNDPTPSGRWEGSANDFCFTCHAGVLPDGIVGAPDVSASYATSSTHGPATGDAAYLRSDMGFTAGDELDCSACHEPHGAPNTLNLRGDVRSKDGTEVRTGLLVFDIPEGGHDTRFFCNACHALPEAAHPEVPGVSTEMAPGISAFPIDCTGCHNHDSGL